MLANLHLLPFELNTRGNLAKNSILFYSIALYSIFFHSFGVLYVALDGSRACSIWTRIENVDRTNQLLLGGKASAAGLQRALFCESAGLHGWIRPRNWTHSASLNGNWRASDVVWGTGRSPVHLRRSSSGRTGVPAVSSALNVLRGKRVVATR